MNELSVELRDGRGKGAARKLRAAGRVPAVLYGGGRPARPLAVDPDALVDIFRKSGDRNTLLHLKVGDASVPALVKDLQRHPVSRQVLHVDFYECEAGRNVEVTVPLLPVGRPVGATLGGRVRLIRRGLRVRCPHDKIPAGLEVDVTPLQVGDMIRVSAVTPPESVEILFDNDFNIVTCQGKRAEIVEETEEESEEDTDAGSDD